MRITAALCRQHIGTMFKRHWQIQGKRIPHKTNAFLALEKKGVPIVNALEVVYPKKEKIPEFVSINYQTF